MHEVAGNLIILSCTVTMQVQRRRERKIAYKTNVLNFYFKSSLQDFKHVADSRLLALANSVIMCNIRS